jgi:ABC-2 type transport system ATP-binding protein
LGLDVQTRTAAWGYIKKLKEEYNMTLFMTTHYLEEADSICDRIAIIDYGKIVALDTPISLKQGLEEETITIKTLEVRKLDQKLKEFDLATKTRISKDQLSVNVKNGHETLPRIVEAAASAGIRVDSISLHEPNLGDVFLHYTGRAIREEKGEEYHGVAAARRRAVR